MRRSAFAAAALAAALIVPGQGAAMAKHQVAGLQVALYRYGLYAGPIDGIPGPKTKRAILALQRSAKLEPDGVPGKATRRALGRYGRPLFGTRTLQRGMAGFDVSVLQYLLASRGFAPPRLNSNFGPVTESLVKRFQRKAGLAPDGVVGAATRAALLGKPASKRATRSQPAKRYVVRPGETLTSIADKHGTTVLALARRNKLDPARFLLAGASIVVPRPAASAAPSVKSAIDHWAAHYGVDPRLARALAWQESGFQSHVRSPAGAGGVMQVIPATWDFVELFVIGKDVPRTADGNVRVGVAYLDHLLREFDGDVRLALGAYNQGPASVRRRGLFAETRQFVANVLALRGRV